MLGIIIVRVFMLAAATGAGMAFGPPLGIHATNWWLGGAGFLFGVLAVLLEWQARKIPVDRIFWGAMGGLAGLGLGLGLGTAMGAVSPDAGPLGRGLFGLLFSYLGASVALAKRDELEDMSAKLFPKTAARREGFKILDTSVIIDGRVVDLCEVGFLEGTLIVPQFVLRELQQIADSPDALKREQGKRGFDVLQRRQRSGTKVRVETRFPAYPRGGRNLMQLGRHGGKVVPTTTPNQVGSCGVSGLNVTVANAISRRAARRGVHVHASMRARRSARASLLRRAVVVVDHGKRFIGQQVSATSPRSPTTAGHELRPLRKRRARPMISAFAVVPAGAGARMGVSGPSIPYPRGRADPRPHLAARSPLPVSRGPRVAARPAVSTRPVRSSRASVCRGVAWSRRGRRHDSVRLASSRPSDRSGWSS